MNRLSQLYRDPKLYLVAGIATALMLSACASTPAPTTNITAAHDAITNAEKADAGHYAAAELGEAREKLTAANAAVKQENMLRARRLADQSHVEADLAFAITDEAKATAVNDEMKTSNTALTEELQRKSGDQQ